MNDTSRSVGIQDSKKIMFNKLLKKVENKMKDHDETEWDQLLKFGKKYLNGSFTGMTIVKPDKMKSYLQKHPLNNNKFYINFDNHHWSAIVRKNNKYYQFDSFNRNLYGNGFESIKLKKNEKQKSNETTCGQHVLTKMLQLF